MKSMNSAQPGRQVQPTFIRLREVIQRTGLSRTTVYELAATGRFPKPVRLTPGSRGASGWVRVEVEAWEEERIAARPAQTSDAAQRPTLRPDRLARDNGS